jgi:hypothetical protein
MRVLPVLLLLGCPPPEDQTPVTDTAETDVDTVDTDPPVPWRVRALADEGGVHLRLAQHDDGRLVAAWWSGAGIADGTCDEVGVAPPPRMRQTVHVAEQAGEDWVVEEVARPTVALAPPGLALALDGERPLLAVTDGVPQGQYCGGHDAVVWSRDGGGWASEVAAAASNDAASGDAASDAGFVVRHDPALAFDDDGHPAVLYRDVHFGALQRDDLFRADAELAWHDGTAWTHEVVDLGRGGGGFNALLFADGRPMAFYAIPVDTQLEDRQGLWVAHRDATGAWNRARLFEGDVTSTIAAGVDPAGAVHVAVYDVDRVRVFTLDDPGNAADPGAWTSETVGDPVFDEGRGVSLGFAADGYRLLAYRRCRRLTDPGTSCDPNVEAVVLASEDASGWTAEVVHEGRLGSCGEFTAVVGGADGSVHVGYRCADDAGGEVTLRPFVASRP